MLDNIALALNTHGMLGAQKPFGSTTQFFTIIDLMYPIKKGKLHSR